MHKQFMTIGEAGFGEDHEAIAARNLSQIVQATAVDRDDRQRGCVTCEMLIVEG